MTIGDKKISETPGEIYLKDPISRFPKAIKRLKLSEAEELLGIFIATDGNSKAQIKKLRKKLQVFGQCIKTGLSQNSTQTLQFVPQL